MEIIKKFLRDEAAQILTTETLVLLALLGILGIGVIVVYLVGVNSAASTMATDVQGWANALKK